MSELKKVYLKEGQILVVKVGDLEFECEYKDAVWLVCNRIIDAGRPEEKPNARQAMRDEL